MFKWLPGYKYAAHRPVTVVNDAGVDLRQINWMHASDLRVRGIYMYHYYCIFLNQVSSKMSYYANWVKANNSTHIVKCEEYFDKTFLELTNPFRIHAVNTWPSWLERFNGTHPVQIQALINDIATGRQIVLMRNMEDVDILVKSTRYRIGIMFWKIWGNYVSQTTHRFREILSDIFTYNDREEKTLLVLVTLKKLKGNIYV